MVRKDCPIPPFASFQVAVLDPEGTVRTRFAWFAFNGKVDIFYAGRKCKMRLFVQKEIFSQCTMCWRHGHSKGDSACKARKELCTRCSDPHRTQMHDQACVKCHGLNRKECKCAACCVNCQGAHRSDDVTCVARLKYRDLRRVPTILNSGGFRGSNGGRGKPTEPAANKAVPVHWHDNATQDEIARGYAQYNEMLAEQANDSLAGWGEPGPSTVKRAPAVPSTPVEGVSASIHAPKRGQKSAHFAHVSASDRGDNDGTANDDTARARASAETHQKTAITQAVSDAAPRPPNPDTRMGSSPIKPAAKTLPKTRTLLTIRAGCIMGRPNDPHVISSQETDPIMRARQQVFTDLANPNEVEHPAEMQGVLDRLNAGLSPPAAAAAPQSSVPTPSSSYPVPHLDLSQFPYTPSASTTYTSMPSSLVTALPPNPQL
jgi:hypothetical protein